jgi:hypothetical protein
MRKTLVATQLNQRFTCSFCALRAQKRKEDSQVVNLFTLQGSARTKAVHKYVDEIDPLCVVMRNYVIFLPHLGQQSSQTSVKLCFRSICWRQDRSMRNLGG